MRKHWQLVELTLLWSILLTGCSDDPDQARVVSNSVSEKASVTSGMNPASENSRSELTVSITPETAFVNTELQAIAGGNPANPTFEWKINGGVVEENKSNRLPVGNYAKGDQVSVTMLSKSESVSASKKIANSPPHIIESNFVEPRLHTGVDVVIEVEVEDADGDSVETRFSWTVNGEIVTGLDINRLPGNMLQRDDRISFTAIPNDGETDGPPYTAGEFTIPNGAPRFVSTYPLKFSNFIYQYPSRAEDPDGDPLHYQLETGPDGMTIDSQTGELWWRIKTSQSGEHHVKIAAVDTEGLKATQEFNLMITIPE